LKIAIIGANGQLGSDISESFKHYGDEVINLNHDQIEISDIDSVSKALKSVKAEMIVNTAAMHNVEKCEDDPVRSYEVNGIGARNLSLVCNETDSLLLHISTDYVFDGQKKAPYIESDMALPLNVYGNTKLSGEHYIKSIASRFFILRISAIYGKKPCRAKGSNFVDLMLKFVKERDEIRVVDDEIVTPTFTKNIAEQIVKLLHSNSESGLFHATSEGSCSWYEFAKEIFLITKADVVLNRADPGEFPMKVNRPKHSVLENKKLKGHNLNIMPHWKDALNIYLKK